MFGLWKEDKRIQTAVQAYLAQVMASLKRLQQVFPECLDGTQARNEDLDNPVHKFESIADDMRRALEHELLAGKLLPESRVELSSLLGNVDRIPNVAEQIVDVFTLQRLEVPSELRDQATQLLAKSLETCAAMSETVRLLFYDISEVSRAAEEVDRIESQTDHMERVLLRHVFSLEIDLANKLQLKEFVGMIASLADRAENVADQVQRIALKRKL